jgi:hypothetical protein
MTTTQTITADRAAELITRTAENNRTGRIGGPFATHGFPLDEALAAITHEGVYHLELCFKNGTITLIVRNFTFGDNHLFINPSPDHTDPWSK